ncbi:hypothetical protein [Streptomyces sp. NBC_01803]|uniref:hypothetical protein n=1 Tax=Streptomyces sp. NBC_01803 TaxID=2975946 RepID=UPI002DDC4BE1|nr:hypothetical protein [Streptomyces sp. NBC_01803]WSA44362.1 hypothetical protein OIE51_09185 [Streptomyces sp. NBC_01803]
MAISAENITLDRFERLLADESVPLVHRALWLLLWESDVRVLDLLALDVADVARAGVADERAVGLLSRLIGERTAGPLLAVGQKVLTWDQAVRTAQGHGHAVHAFRTSGRRHRRAAPAPASRPDA